MSIYRMFLKFFRFTFSFLGYYFLDFFDLIDPRLLLELGLIQVRISLMSFDSFEPDFLCFFVFIFLLGNIILESTKSP